MICLKCNQSFERSEEEKKAYIEVGLPEEPVTIICDSCLMDFIQWFLAGLESALVEEE